MVASAGGDEGSVFDGGLMDDGCPVISPSVPGEGGCEDEKLFALDVCKLQCPVSLLA
jgi:hypothetical protein